MSETTVTPVLDLTTLIVQAGLIPTRRKAQEEAKVGNIYAEIMPDDTERSYWVRLDYVRDGVFVLPSRTRLKWIDPLGEEHIVTVVPRPGRVPFESVTN